MSLMKTLCACAPKATNAAPSANARTRTRITAPPLRTVLVLGQRARRMQAQRDKLANARYPAVTRWTQRKMLRPHDLAFCRAKRAAVPAQASCNGGATAWFHTRLEQEVVDCQQAE